MSMSIERKRQIMSALTPQEADALHFVHTTAWQAEQSAIREHPSLAHRRWQVFLSPPLVAILGNALPLVAESVIMPNLVVAEEPSYFANAAYGPDIAWVHVEMERTPLGDHVVGYTLVNDYPRYADLDPTIKVVLTHQMHAAHDDPIRPFDAASDSRHPSSNSH